MADIIEHYYRDQFVGYWKFGKIPQGKYVTETLRGVGARIIFGPHYDGRPFTPAQWENLCEHLGGSANPLNSFRIMPEKDYIPPVI